jgi:enoyl-[acyl-carrier protein] reductase III
MVGDRPLQVEDIANAVLFLCSPQSDLIQAHTLVIDGGAGLRG